MRVTQAVCSMLLLLASGCAAVVSVTPSGNAKAAPRAANCSVEFFRSKAPERPYDELAALHSQGGMSPEAVQEEMRAKACSVGADAVIVTRDYIPGTRYVPAVMTGTAVKYKAAPAEPRASAQ